MSSEEQESNNNSSSENEGGSADSDSGQDQPAEVPPIPQGKPIRMYSEGKRFPKDSAETTDIENQEGGNQQDSDK